MERLMFSVLLSEEDIKQFLVTRAGFEECEFGTNTLVDRSNELIQVFSCKSKTYLLAYTDFSMVIKECKSYSEPREALDVEVSFDDWLCFMKEKFGEMFVKHYAGLFEAEKIIFEESTFLSKVSKEELSKVIGNILNEGKIIGLPCSNLEITEVESFYLSERRFFVKSKTDNRFCFVRVSDFGFVEPRLSNTLFHRLMVDKFGKEYIDSFEKYLFSNLEVEGVPKFIAKCHERIEKRVTELLVYLNYTSK